MAASWCHQVRGSVVGATLHWAPVVYPGMKRRTEAAVIVTITGQVGARACVTPRAEREGLMSVAENEEFQGFVAARWTALVRTAYLLTGDQQLAEDLVQTALERTFRHWASLRRRDAAEAYVRQTMYREQVTSWRRRRVREVAAADLPEPRQHSSAVEPVEDRLVLRAALDRLGRRQRAVLVLRFFEDLSERQVADALGIGVGTVKSTSHRALAHMREALDQSVLPSGVDRR